MNPSLALKEKKLKQERGEGCLKKLALSLLIKNLSVRNPNEL